MTDPIVNFDALLAKGGEYYQCAAHLHARGAAAVIEECREIVFACIAAGRSFDDLVAYMEAKFGERPDPEKDLFLVAIKKLWG